MTNEEAKEFLDNLKICIKEHPVVADWLVEIADRKTEPLTPNYCGSCKYREVPCGDLPCDVCHNYSNYEPKDEPQTERTCTNCKHNGVLSVPKCDECHGMDKHEFIEPQTERSE